MVRLGDEDSEELEEEMKRRGGERKSLDASGERKEVR